MTFKLFKIKKNNTEHDDFNNLAEYTTETVAANDNKVQIQTKSDTDATVTLKTENEGRSDDLRENRWDDPTSMYENLGWRLLRVLILAACYFVLEVIVKLVTVMQFIYIAWKKKPHKGMQLLGRMIADYMQMMWTYCTFASNHAPWPFTPWQRVDTKENLR